jgi:hypothetical protein
MVVVDEVLARRAAAQGYKVKSYLSLYISATFVALKESILKRGQGCSE